MKGRLTIITPDGARTSTDLTAPPPLEVMQNAVGGYIERIPFFEEFEKQSCVALCNEDGKNIGLAYNEAAQELWQAAVAVPITDYLVGTIAIITGDDELIRAL